MDFKKSNYFSNSGGQIFLSHCSVSRLLPDAARAICKFNMDQSEFGFRMFHAYGNVLDGLHKSASEIMKTKPDNVSFLTNTSEGLNIIANGYPFQNGDSIISFIHEYPSNHYPWALQSRRGVKLDLIQNHIPCDISTELKKDMPCRFSVDDIEKLITKKTRIIALSHVQFTSGFAADLKLIGEICRHNGIDLIVDAAQSLGSMPLYPEAFGIAAIAASGWKWMMGPIGTGLLYTSPEFREKISHTMAGADLMEQGQDYLNHSWSPLEDGRRFEYSTRPLSHAYGLNFALQNILQHSQENIFQELIRLQDIFLAGIDRNKYTPVEFKNNRSGILSIIPRIGTENVTAKAAEKNLMVTERGGYLRIAPHFYNTDVEMQSAVEILNSI